MFKSRHIRALTVLLTASAAALGAVGCSAGAGAEHSGSIDQAFGGDRAPRLFLTPAVISRLQARAAVNDAGWTQLKARCDGLATGTFYPPGGNAYANFPDVGQGYQGDGYLPEIMNLGLCYQTVKSIDAAAAAKYGAAGGRLLDVMATPVSSGGESPSTDSGYGMRNYGVGMAIGYDWLYGATTDAQKQHAIDSLNVWVDWYDASGFSKNDPVGNYFAGYVLAKTTAALATEGDNPKAPTYWADVQTRMWTQLVKPQFQAGMSGGGWPEGWQYGPRAVENYAEFLWAVKTAKGLDWWSEVPHARDEAKYMTYFAWPSLLHMDDQGTVHAQARLSPAGGTVHALTAMMQYNGDAYASTARSFANDLIATNQDSVDAWQRFLFRDDTLAVSTYTSQPLSYFAQGPGHVAVRSSWAKDAVWGSFVSGKYIDAPDSGEQYFNQGSVAIVHGDQPIVINATGWLPQAAGDQGEQFVYDDTWGNRTRKLNNTFYVANATQDAMVPAQTSTHVTKYEEGGSFVHAQGAGLGDVYQNNAVSQFTRDFAYVRPGLFVVYDRTTVGSASDQWLAWHTPSQPVTVATSDATQKRYDVQAGGATVGSIRSLLPKSVSSTTVATIANAAFRIENHAPTNASQQDWLTTISVGGSVPEQARLSADDGNVTVGSMVGVHAMGARNAVVLFAADHGATGTVNAATYSVAQNADGDHVLIGMAPGGYSVTSTIANGKITIKVVAGGSIQASSQGTLAFSVSANGAVAGQAPPPPPPPPGGDGGAGGGGSSLDFVINLPDEARDPGFIHP